MRQQRRKRSIEMIIICHDSMIGKMLMNRQIENKNDRDNISEKVRNR